jgi:hypothetical protein
LDSKRSIVFPCHQGGYLTTLFEGRRGKFHCSLPATLGISIDLRGIKVKFRELPTSPHKSVVRYGAPALVEGEDEKTTKATASLRD